MQDRELAIDVPVRSAATVMVVRDGVAGVEVLMLQRTFSASFARGNYVFPGGRVDDADHAAELEPVCAGETDVAASARLGLEHGGLAWLVAAIRECFEEAGVLYARRGGENEVARFGDPPLANGYADDRTAIHSGDLTIADLCARHGLELLTERLHPVAHWLTPLGERRRFDTRFFVAVAPDGQTALHDDHETIDSVWIRPDDALTMWAAHELMMFPPTVVCLRWLADHRTTAEVIAAARQLAIPERITPRLVLDADERVVAVLVPGDDGFESTPVPHYVIGNPR